MLSRRKFVQLSSLASASLMLPRFVHAFTGSPAASGVGRKKLIVIQLSGGNDGLNTVIPVRNDIYYRSRADIGIAADKALSLSDELALNPALAGFKNLYDSGALTLLNGVGYAQPNRSHFRSMDIWQSGSAADEVLSTGWIGRFLDATANRQPTMGIEVDDSLSLAMKGAVNKGLAIRDAAQFYNAAKTPYFTAIAGARHADEHASALPDYLYKTLRETISSAEYVHGHFNSGKTAQTYPNTAIGKRIKTIASLILSDADTVVYYASHGSFDTHAGQRGRQDKLLQELDEAIAPLVADLKAAGLFNDVMIMTFSEFGRRVAQNASGGTDHGTAAPMFFISGGLKKPGIYNPLPDLADLDEGGDIKYAIDFKAAYQTVLSRWLEMSSSGAILSKAQQPLTFI